jgi:hypothetical protein
LVTAWATIRCDSDTAACALYACRNTPLRTMMRLSGSVTLRCALSVGFPARVVRT